MSRNPPQRIATTHAISCFKIIQSSLAFINTWCLPKSECKDTTIFQTTKIFFHFFRPKQDKQLWINLNFFSFFYFSSLSIPCKISISTLIYQVLDIAMVKPIVDNVVCYWLIVYNTKHQQTQNNHNKLIYNILMQNLITYEDFYIMNNMKLKWKLNRLRKSSGLTSNRTNAWSSTVLSILTSFFNFPFYFLILN